MRSRLALILVAAPAALLAVSAAGAVGRTVTIGANHSVAEDGVPVLLSGVVSNHRRGESVTIEEDQCGPAPWRPLRTVNTGPGGGWSSFGGGDVGTRLRARWRVALSRVIRIGAHPELSVAPTATQIHVLVRAHIFFDRVRVLLQRGIGGRWVTVRSGALHRLGTVGAFQQSEARIRRPPKHGTYRVFLPAASAAPCYIATATPSVKL